MWQRWSPEQDGGGKQGKGTRGSHTQNSAAQGRRSSRAYNSPTAEQYSLPPSASSSPAKSKPKLDHTEEDDEAVSLHSSQDDTRELQDSITDFPTANTPIMDTTLKDMLISLRSTLHADIQSLTRQFKSEISSVNKRISHVETKMGEFACTFNDLVDAHNDRDDDMLQLKLKLANLEDRSRRNNVKIRGIPESVKNPDLKPHFI